MILRALLFFFFVCFAIWGLMFYMRELSSSPREEIIKTTKAAATAVGIGAIALGIVFTFVILF